MNELYQLIENKIKESIPDLASIRFKYQFLDNTDEHTIGIILYTLGDDKPNIDGGYPMYNIGVHIQYSVSKSKQETVDSLTLIENIVMALETLNIQDDNIIIQLMQHKGPLAIIAGVNDNGIGQIVSNFLCQYSRKK